MESNYTNKNKTFIHTYFIEKPKSPEPSSGS